MSALLRGRVLALLGILLVAVNVRTAVSALSPIADRVGVDIHLDELGLGLLGAMPPIGFAIAAVGAPVVARRIGIEAAMAIACGAMVVGPVIRGVADSYPPLVIGTAITLIGMGFGNVLLPPAVKKYFPDRIGALSAAYLSLLAVSTTGAAILAEPVAAGAGWRFALIMWGGLAFVALVPWLGLLAGRRRAGDAEVIPELRLAGPVWRSGVAWSLALLLLLSAFMTYALFAWLPLMLVDIAGVTAAQGGALLALYAVMGLPTGFIVPVLAVRMRSSSWLIVIAVVSFLVGCAGLLLAPASSPWLWMVLVGLTGSLVFPLTLVLINLRTRTVAGSMSASGFAQAVGYTVGALGPLVVALAHDWSGGWTIPILVLAGSVLVMLVPAFTLRRRVFVEDQLG